MKFGLMVVQNTDNIGDDIQSYAALKFLPEVDFYIDREKLDAFCGDQDNQQVAVIMNAWYMYNKFNWPPSPYINPLFISMHISKNDYYGIGTKFLDDLGGEYLRKYEPIGARDQATQRMLEEKGIKAYVSGCLTLTLDKFDDIPKTDMVYLVDIEENDRKRLKEYYPNEKFEEVTHSVNYMNSNISYNDRMLKVEELLKKYQGAKCVITSRLHCALPCLALGVPVLMVYQDNFKDRIESFLKYFFVTTSKEIERNQFEFDISNPPLNKKDYIAIRENIKKCCEDFIAHNLNANRKCEQNDMYEILSWQDNLINNAELGFREQILEYKKWCSELENGKEWSESQYKNIKEEYDKLKDWCDEVQEGKEWSENQYKNIKEEYDKLKSWCDEVQEGKEWSENQYKNIKEEYDKLKSWCDELQKGKDWIENEWKYKCEECEKLKEALKNR